MPDASRMMKSRTLRNELLSELGAVIPSRRRRNAGGDEEVNMAVPKSNNKSKPLKSILRNKTSTNSTPDLWSLDQDCYKDYCGPRPIHHHKSRQRPKAKRTDTSPTPPTRRSSMEQSKNMRRIASAPDALDDLSMTTIHCPKARAVVVVVEPFASPKTTARQDVAPRAPLRRSSVHP